MTRTVWHGFAEHDVLTYASAISFQMLGALIPFVLFLLAVIGLFDLEGTWTRDIAPEVHRGVSDPVFAVIDQTVRNVFSSSQTFWLTGGALLTLWEVSGAVRAVMGVLDGVYGVPRKRTFVQRYRRSLSLSVAVGLCFVAAGAVARFSPDVLDGVVGSGTIGDLVIFVVRWGVAAVLLGLAVDLLIRYAPSSREPHHLAGLGATLVIGAWVVFTIGFSFYLSDIASYGSIFGSVASIFVLMTYLYISTIVFLAGALLDAAIQTERAARRAQAPELARVSV